MDATAQAALLAEARGARDCAWSGPTAWASTPSRSRLNGTYFWDLPRLAGGISVVSQSGAYGGLIFRHLGSRGLGVARFLSIGNQADVDIAEVIEWLVDDPATTLIACFVEALRDGPRFLAAAERAAGRKPIVMLKGGRSDAGRRAAGSHTGSLAGAWEVYRAACASARVVLAEETEEFFDAVETLVAIPTAPADRAPRGGGDRVGRTVGDRRRHRRARRARGPRAGRGHARRAARAGRAVRRRRQPGGSHAADRARQHRGRRAPRLRRAEHRRRGRRERGARHPRVRRRDRGRLARDGQAGGGLRGRRARGHRALRGRAACRCCRAPSGRCARGARSGGRVRWLRVRRSRRSRGPGRFARRSIRPTGALPYALARRLLEVAGVRFCREAIVARTEDAVATAEQFGYPVVVKADAAGLAHKTEAGGVIVDVAHPAAVRTACAELRTRTGARRFIVQERVGPGVELLLGARRDEVFGPVVVFGVGGILTEVLHDVSVRLAPVSEDDAAAMLDEGVRPRLLAGPRGLRRVDRPPLIAVDPGDRRPDRHRAPHRRDRRQPAHRRGARPRRRRCAGHPELRHDDRVAAGAIDELLRRSRVRAARARASARRGRAIWTLVGSG